jgi:trehalose utilization protein
MFFVLNVINLYTLVVHLALAETVVTMTTVAEAETAVGMEAEVVVAHAEMREEEVLVIWGVLMTAMVVVELEMAMV